MSRQQFSSNFRMCEQTPERKFQLVKISLFVLLTAYCLLLTAVTAYSQKLAFLAPDKSPNSNKIQLRLKENLAEKFDVADDSLAEIVLENAAVENAFNLSTEEAQNLGKALGCNFFLLVKSDTLRRTVLLANPDFYIESYAAVYLVSTRTGHLVFWKLESFKAQTASEAQEKLSASLANLAAEISANLKSAERTETTISEQTPLEELPAENSPEAKNFRVPLPYRRFTPEYTAAANLYGITATVDSLVDLDENGKVKRIEITRWAGYGLDESVAATIKKMQWRAAERNGKQLPIRVLLRYNFKKIEHNDE